MATLAELLAVQCLPLSGSQLAQLEWLAVELLRWNRKYNLTAITERDAVYEKHLVDSLTLHALASRRSRLLDLGSGAGFPALPLKIACPALDVVAVDAVAKKIRFQRHVARTLGLQRFAALHQRAEAMALEPAYRGAFDLVTSRALGNLTLLAELAAPLLAEGGCLVAMKGPEAERELAAHGTTLANAGWKIETEQLVLPLSGAVRWLLTLHRKTE